jgi:predicted DNA-binding transcriptional regulator YafY
MNENGSLPPVAQSHGREADWRESEIHRLLSDRTRARKRNPRLPLWNCVTLAKELGYSRQWILRDINHMIDKGYPIARDTRLKGYYYTQSFTPMLAQVITERELTRLFLAVRAIQALKDSPIFAPVLADLQKLLAALIDKLGLDYAALSSCITVRNTGIDPYVEPEALETLTTAIREHQELKIVYSKLHESNPAVEASLSEGAAACDIRNSAATAAQPSSADTLPHPSAPWLPLHVETRTVHPLHILCLDHVWYLYLWDPMRKDLRRFMFSRMHSITLTGETFKPRKFSVNKQLAGLGVTGGDPVKVRIHFRRKGSYLVAERPWHHTQELAPGPDSEWNLELTMNVAITPELIRWLMGYDQDFRVMEPADLKDIIDRKVDGMVAVR